ncbi:sulfatase-like hydrolase/transferase [Neolewinella agarilytica]|uniref:Arylsulfatase A n=1 Tax=Neolewinella agarilytica TaxID=478744 RepID=A0A1H9D7N9_9BACT|nr:sulfatase-like hydrolase/transferase [Neolewinella agarilytica]SEQ09485.1 Arylsulfatase A [Neolewinella agarilytica]
MKGNYYILILIFASMAFAFCGETADVPEETIEQKTPNIVFIISDDQAWTDYGFMGHKQLKTPNIDKLANEGLTFVQSYVPTSLCAPSLASIVTGVYPRRHQVLGNDRMLPTDKPKDKADRRKIRAERYRPVIDHFKQLNTLPEMLKDKGYLSFQTGKWWLGNYANGGFDRGMTHGDPARGGRHGDYGLEIGRNGMDTLFNYIDYALEEEKPFFVWYAPYLPHRPHNPPDSLFQKYLPLAPSEYVAKYWAMCEWFDNTCGELIDYLDEKGQNENTLYVYVCDNGWVQEENAAGYTKNSKRSPYDYGMRTPIIYKWSGHIEPGYNSRSLASSLDIVPTVLSLLGMERPEGLDGINVLDKLALEKRETLYGEIYAHDFTTVDNSLFYQMAITSPYKIIVPNKANKPNETVQLYDIIKDPFEQKDLAADKPEIVEQLINKIEASWNQ